MLLSCLALAAFALACYGFGRAAFRLCYPDHAPLHAYATALGLVTLALVGGLLNALRIAADPALAICLYAGVAAGLAFLALDFRTTRVQALARPAAWPTWARAAAVAAAGIWLTAVLVPAGVFNSYDDFFSYLPRMVRMRQAGTLAGNPFELLGLSDQGVQSLFQAMLSAWLPLDGAYAFDSIVCFLLGIALLIEFGRSLGAPRLVVALVVAVYVVINPQIVNLSSVYSGAVLILALLGASQIVLDEIEGGAPMRRLALAALPLGATVGTLIAIKTTHVLFLAPFCAVLFGVLLFARPRASMLTLGAATVGTLAVVLPWAAVNIDKLDAARWVSSERFLDPELTVHPSLLNAFGNPPSYYGGMRAEYLIGVMVLAVALAAGTVRMVRTGNAMGQVVSAAGTFAGMVSYFALTAVFNDDDSLRYAIPVLIALLPMALLWNAGPAATAALGPDALVAVAAMLVVLIATFARYVPERVARLASQRSVVSMPVPEHLVADQRASFGADAKAAVRAVQDNVPAGSTIWAWVDAPFNLDFARNRVWHFHHDWSVAPWRIDASTSDALRRALEARGVQYIVWQYRSKVMLDPDRMRESLKAPDWSIPRIIHRTSVELTDALAAIATPFDIVHNNGTMVVIALAPPTGRP